MEAIQTYQSIAKEVLRIEATGILELIDQLDSNFDGAIEKILTLKGKVVVSGIGKSGHIGTKIAATFSSTGTPSIFLHPAEAVHGDLGKFQSEDLFLAISNSGETEEILKLIPFVKERKMPIVALCSNHLSTLGRQSDFFIKTKVRLEACPLELAPTASTTATLSMGDAMAIALMRARGFRADHFAVFHPAGNLGKKLLTTVGSVMRTENLPILAVDATVKDLVIKLSEGKLGLVIVGTRERVQGVITDGDLRRALEHTRFHDLALEKIMTKSPIIISEQLKLIEAEQLMIQHKITTLLVENEYNKLVGALQLYDFR